MSVQLHPDIETLDKESLCYSIYAQLYHNFFNAQQKKDDEHPYGIEEGDETSLRLKNTAYGFASAIAGAVTGEGGSGSGGLLLDYLKKSAQHITPTGLFETDLVIMLPCYFSQPKQIVEEIIMSFLLFIFLFLHSKHNVRQPIAVYGNLFISLNYKYIS